MKAIALVSGGLDSTLASRIVKDLGIELIALNTRSPFCLCNRKRRTVPALMRPAGFSGIRPKADCHKYLRGVSEIVKPKHGYGSNMNPLS